MRFLVGKAGFDIMLREGEERPIEGRLVRVKVHACGVCGTDLHFLRDAEDYTPLGHEIAAEVVEIAQGVTRVAVGDRVIVEDVTMCGACEACKSGRVGLCQGGMTLDGQSGMADCMVVHENMLNPFSRMDWTTASMVEPLAVAIRCVETLGLPCMGSVLIYGLGAIGLLSAAYLRFIGAGRVVMAARGRGRLRARSAEEAAKDLGVDEVLYMDEDGWEALEERFDAAIVAAPPSLTEGALKKVRYGGKVLACGITLGGGGACAIDVNDMVRGKKQLLTSIAEPALNFPLAIRLIESGAVQAGRVITHALPLTRFDQLKELYGQDAPAIKTVMLCGE